MAKTPADKSPTRRSRQPRSASRQACIVQREPTSGPLAGPQSRFEAVMRAAERSGLLSNKGSRIGGRVSAALVRQAKRQTGIDTDTDLIAFALATIALEDNFAETFKDSRGKVDPKLKLGF